MERSTAVWIYATALMLVPAAGVVAQDQPPVGPPALPMTTPGATQVDTGGLSPPQPPGPGASTATGRTPLAGEPTTSDDSSNDASRSPLDTGARLSPPKPVAGELRFPINLATALRLTDARPLIVAAAQASVWVAEADLAHAKILWIPTLNIGFDYIRHDGGGPDFNKGILTAVSTNFLYAGAGLTGFPFGIIPITDAIYEPLVARQNLNARHWDVQSAKNDALMRTADAYFLVHQYRGMYAGSIYCVERGHELIERIAVLSRDLVPKVEVDRARNLVADLEQRAVSARQQWRVTSADLTQVLRLDPRAVVEPLEHDHLQVTLIDPARPLEDLMAVAMTNRPELSSRQAMVAAAEVAVRREKARPFIPNFALNGFQTPLEALQAGIFGFGPNSSLNQFVGRFDLSLQPLWQLDAIGLGNLALIKHARGQESQAIVELFRVQDMVVADITRALARVQSAAARVVLADRALRTGIITVNGNFEGLKQISRFGNVLVLINRPQEAVFALQLLHTAFNEYFTTVAEYNRAQFELFHALGYPARELAIERPPGDVQPVDTSRPDFLPPVGNGPPPATR